MQSPQTTSRLLPNVKFRLTKLYYYDTIVWGGVRLLRAQTTTPHPRLPRRWCTHALVCRPPRLLYVCSRSRRWSNKQQEAGNARMQLQKQQEAGQINSISCIWLTNVVARRHLIFVHDNYNISYYRPADY